MTNVLTEEFVATQGRRAGPLHSHVGPFAARVETIGYARSTAKEKVRLIADLGRWLGRRQLAAEDVSEQRIGEFIRQRRRRGARTRGSAETLRLLLEYLRSGDVARPLGRPRRSAIERIMDAFIEYLLVERGLSTATRVNYVPIIHRFLTERFDSGKVRLGALRARDAGRFVLRTVHTMSPGRAKLMVTALRTFLRWVHLRGDSANDLTATVPSVADWRMTVLPKSIPSEDVERLLRHCRRRKGTGVRDLAILLLLARLGLRGGEVVALELDDIDWHRGTIMIRGKGGRRDELPLPHDVGVALASYLRHHRPVCSTRRIFVRSQAPRRGFASTVAICTIVRRALERAGLNPPRKGGHILRHALACTMLRRGGSLAEIGDVLRHRHPDTTAVYAKVDLIALRSLAPPWPGARA